MRHFGWVLFAVTCGFIVLDVIMLLASNYSLISTDVLISAGFPLIPIGAIVGAAVGALIVSNYPRNAVGWLFCIGQLGSAISLAAKAFYDLVSQGQIDAPTAGFLAATVSDYLDATFTAAFLALIFMIAPEGRLLSRWWWFAVPLPMIAWVLRVAGITWFSISSFQQPEPTKASPLLLGILYTSAILLVLSLLLGTMALGTRTRRATGDRRRPLRWITTSAVVLTIGFVVAAGAGVVFGPDLLVLDLVLQAAYIGVTVSVGVAILRHRLYNIEVFLSRAIALGVLAVFVTVGYIGVVVAIGAVLAAIGTPGSSLYWPSLVATALVAVAFQPLRRHVLRLADQLVYGNRAAPYEALASLSRRLADSPSPDELPPRVAQASGRAVGAAHTRVTISEPDSGSTVRSADWTDDTAGAGLFGGQTLLLPVRDEGEQVGNIEVTMPPGRSLRAFERNLLVDVAAQAGVAFRNALLQAELAARVADGEAKSAAVIASRRRLVGVEDEARERLAAAIRRRVVPHLAVVDTELCVSCDPADPTEPRARLERLIGETERALEELRQVCRGVFPALLERRGLVPALIAQLDNSHPVAQVDIDESAERRLNRATEAAGYVFCTEVAPTDRPSVIALRVEEQMLIASVTASCWPSDVSVPTRSAEWPAWQHARDRVAALDGEIVVHNDGDATTVSAIIPIEDQADRDRAMSAQTASSRSGPKADFGT